MNEWLMDNLGSVTYLIKMVKSKFWYLDPEREFTLLKRGSSIPSSRISK
jgi:hypothetical protein